MPLLSGVQVEFVELSDHSYELYPDPAFNKSGVPAHAMVSFPKSTEHESGTNTVTVSLELQLLESITVKI